jgi:hypothetical protein
VGFERLAPLLVCLDGTELGLGGFKFGQALDFPIVLDGRLKGADRTAEHTALEKTTFGAMSRPHWVMESITVCFCPNRASICQRAISMIRFLLVAMEIPGPRRSRLGSECGPQASQA